MFFSVAYGETGLKFGLGNHLGLFFLYMLIFIRIVPPWKLTANGWIPKMMCLGKGNLISKKNAFLGYPCWISGVYHSKLFPSASCANLRFWMGKSWIILDILIQFMTNLSYPPNLLGTCGASPHGPSECCCRSGVDPWKWTRNEKLEDEMIFLKTKHVQILCGIGIILAGLACMFTMYLLYNWYSCIFIWYNITLKLTQQVAFFHIIKWMAWEFVCFFHTKVCFQLMFQAFMQRIRLTGEDPK